LYGQACWHPGFVKNTYGTGCFLMMFSGQQVVESDHGLLTTLACDSNGNPAYALEGAVFSAGSTIQWLRDELHLIQTAAETEKIAESIDDTNGVYLVPAFTGLGAPYWNMSVRAALIGLTRGSGRNEIVRAALESLAYQTKDLVDLMSEESQVPIRELRVDGGASQNNFLMQFQADLLDCTVNRPKNIESTVMGAVMLAGKAIGYWKTETELEQIRQTDELFEQIMDHKRAEFLYRGWQDAVRQLLK
ncbi:MAG: glycerol kinase, partial [Calditrichaeota bacterium]|nr:glycerol kinase [Calditrichota bacterium]